VGAILTETAVPATVARLDAKGCLVWLDEQRDDIEGDGWTLWCNVRGRIHLRDRTHQKSPVAPGDRVHVIRTAPDRGAVESIEPRSSSLSLPGRGGRIERVMAANVERVMVVTSADDPPFTPGLVDRVLAVVEYSRLEAVIVVNKMDLVESEPEEAAVYRRIGYEVLPASATDGTGIESVAAALRDRSTVVTGHSGVGKSSLLNVVQPGLGLKVGEVNPTSGRGTHTTTAAVWIPLEGGGAVIDTAGVREFGLYGIPKRDLGWLYKGIAAVAPGCRYPDCSHTHEPECAVQEALVEGEIAPQRFDSYLRIWESLGQ